MAFSPIDGIYLTYSTIGIFIFSVFVLLHLQNKSKFYDQPKLKYTPLVSIIVPAWNEENVLSGTLDSINKLNWPRDKLEVIVVNDGSTDKTSEVAKRYGWVKLIEKENGGKASALNVGIKKAQGAFIACIDSDSYPEPDALKYLMPHFEEEGVGAVVATILPKSPKTFIQKLQAIEYTVIAWNRKLLQFIDAIYVTPGALAIYRKDALEKIGNFDEKCITEDIEITWRLQRARYKVRASLNARVYTDVPKTLRLWWKQRLRWHLGGEQTILKHRGAFFDKNKNKVKTFIAPYQISSYIVSILGISTGFYIFARLMYRLILFGSLASKVGLTFKEQTKLFAPVFLPNIFLIFGLLIFTTSIIFTKLATSSVKYEQVSTFSSIKYAIRLLIYVSLYVMIFPFVLIHSLWRLAIRRIDW